MNNEQLSRYIILSFGLICLIMLILTILSHIHISQWLGQDEIIIQINKYLNEAQKTERQDLLILLDLETLLSPMKHSSTDVSFIADIKVGVGDILTSFNKIISDTIKTYIFTISTIEVIKYVIIINEIITSWLFIGVLIAGTAFGFFHSLFDSYGLHIALCNQIMKIVVVLFFVLYILLPYSLFATAILSKNIINEDRVENRERLHDLYNQINMTYKKEDYKKRAESSIHSFEKTILDLPHKTELIVIHHTKHMAMSVFEFIILPIILVLMSIGILRWTIKTEEVL